MLEVEPKPEAWTSPARQEGRGGVYQVSSVIVIDDDDGSRLEVGDKRLKAEVEEKRKREEERMARVLAKLGMKI